MTFIDLKSLHTDTHVEEYLMHPRVCERRMGTEFMVANMGGRIKLISLNCHEQHRMEKPTAH